MWITADYGGVSGNIIGMRDIEVLREKKMGEFHSAHETSTRHRHVLVLY